MALRLIPEFHLLVIRVELTLVAGENVLDLKIYRHNGFERESFGHWRSPLAQKHEEISLDTSLRELLAGQPRQEAGKVVEGLSAQGFAPQTPLWLHLIKPYGPLGGFPWEAELESMFGRPVLRLPDFTERPPENTRSLDVAVIADVTAGSENAAQVAAAVQQIVDNAPRDQIQIYLFVGYALLAPMRASFRKEPRVWVGRPAGAQAGDSAAWLDGAIRTLAGRSIDHLHVIGTVRSTVGGPAMAMTDPAAKAGAPSTLTFCPPRLLAAALTRLGAWSAGFTPELGASHDQVRQFADAVAQTRPASVVFTRDPTALGPCCRFLFASAPAWPPSQGESFIYCHPSLVPDSTFGDAALTVTQQNADLFQDDTVFTVSRPLTAWVTTALGFTPPQAGSANTPGWIAATQRYVESTALSALREQSGDALLASNFTSHDVDIGGVPVSSGQSVADTVNSTLSNIQSIVANYAQPQRLQSDE